MKRSSQELGRTQAIMHSQDKQYAANNNNFAVLKAHLHLRLRLRLRAKTPKRHAPPHPRSAYGLNKFSTAPLLLQSIYPYYRPSLSGARVRSSPARERERERCKEGRGGGRGGRKKGGARFCGFNMCANKCANCNIALQHALQPTAVLLYTVV